MAITTNVTAVSPEISIKGVLQKMQSNFIKYIVIQVNNKPLGIVTERDIGKFLENDNTARALEEISIEQVMKKDLIIMTDGTHDHVNQAAKNMDIFKIGSVITVDSNENLTGMITKTDIVKIYGAVYGAKFKVKDHMSSKVITCRKSDSLRFALNMINQNHISRLVVTNNDGKALGMITTNTFLTHSTYFTKAKDDTRKYLLPEDSENMSVGDLVSKEVLAVNLEDDLSVAAQKMIKNHISGIPVTDEHDQLVGVVTNSDVVKAFVKVPLTKELLQKYSELY